MSPERSFGPSSGPLSHSAAQAELWDIVYFRAQRDATGHQA